MVTHQFSSRVAYRFSLFRHSGAKRVQPRWEDSEWELKEKSRLQQSPDDPALDILALMELRRRAYDVFLKWHKAQFQSLPSEVDRDWFLEQLKVLTTPADFFTWSGIDSETPLYHQLPVIQRKAVGSETELIELANQLSEFLIHLQQKQSHQGVLITTRSGGGKTVACRQADLLFLGMQQLAANDNKDEQHPSIIPVWMSLHYETTLKQKIWPNIEGKSPQDQIKQITKRTRVSLFDVLIELLVANTHPESKTTDDELQTRKRAMLRQLYFGPSLVLFFDLNYADELERELYAEAIIAFQKHDKLGKKHRCVVVYRGAGKGDCVIQRLLASNDSHWPGFREYDLKTIEDQQAIDYCGQIREFEQRLWKDSETGLTKRINERFEGRNPDLVPCQPVIDGSDEQTRTLLQQLIRRSRIAKSYGSDSNQAKEEDNDSLISVPLLMHWVSLLESKALSRIANLTYLYREIVSQHLIREQAQLGLHKDLIDFKNPQEGEETNRKPVTGKIVTGMTRIALAILAQGAGTTISVDEASDLLEDPLEYPEDDSQDWHLQSAAMPSLSKSEYNDLEFKPEQEQAILRHGLFRQEGNQLRFAHDSLIYYFAGTALREFKKPGKPGTGSKLPEDWPEAIAEILLKNPGRWLQPVEFLGGAMLLPPQNGKQKGQPSQSLRELVMRLVAFWPDLPRDEAIAFMEPVPELVSRLCSTQPHDRVLQQVYQATNDHSRFAWEHPHLLLQEVMNRCRWFGAPGNEVEQRAMQLDEFLEKTSSSRKNNQPEWLKKLVGSRLNDTLTIEGAHTDSINSLAVYEGLEGPRIVSVGEDKQIVISNPWTGEVEQAIDQSHTDWIRAHEAPINCVAVYKGPDGPRIVSAGVDGRIVISDLQTKAVEDPIASSHTGSIKCVAVYEGSDGSQIVSGGEDARITISNFQTGKMGRTILEIYTGSFVIDLEMYTGPNGLRIVSVGEDEEIVIIDPRNGQVELSIEGVYSSSIESVAAYEGPTGLRIIPWGMMEEF